MKTGAIAQPGAARACELYNGMMLTLFFCSQASPKKLIIDLVITNFILMIFMSFAQLLFVFVSYFQLITLR